MRYTAKLTAGDAETATVPPKLRKCFQIIFLTVLMAKLHEQYPIFYH